MKKILLYGAIAIMTWLILYCTIDMYKAPTIEGAVGKKNPKNDVNKLGGKKIPNIDVNNLGDKEFPKIDVNNLGDKEFPKIDVNNLGDKKIPKIDVNNLGGKKFPKIDVNNLGGKKFPKIDVNNLGGKKLNGSLPRINANDIALLNRRMDGINSNNLTLDRMKRITESNSAAIDILVGATK
jgi:hypothetical protein